MTRIQSKTTKIVSLLILAASLLHGQNKPSFFYFNLNAAQEYHSNLYRLPDSLKKADYRFNSFIRIGCQKNWPKAKRFVNIYYENRLRRYFTYQTYSRMAHILFAHGYFPLWSLTRLIINERFRYRDYNHSSRINSLRNVFSFYWQTAIWEKLQLNSGYRHWLKRYPNTTAYQDYMSHRLFFNIYYSLNKKSKLGLRNEVNWHNGNLYPYGAPKKPGTNLHGVRYTAELSGNRIFAGKYFIDLRYRFEWDRPQDIEVQNTGEYSGDENTEDLLAEDSDFDYVKHQLSVSLLYKTTARLSFFGFAVLQSKQFRHWRITENGPLRGDMFGYLSFTARYKLHKNLFAELYFNLENNHSNLSYYQYSRKITGAGLRYKF